MASHDSTHHYVFQLLKIVTDPKGWGESKEILSSDMFSTAQAKSTSTSAATTGLPTETQ